MAEPFPKIFSISVSKSARLSSIILVSLYKNLSVEKIISQSQFLQKMGILERSKMLSHKMDYKRKIDLYSRIQRLINPNMMGETFKVIFDKNKKYKIS